MYTIVSSLHSCNYKIACLASFKDSLHFVRFDLCKSCDTIIVCYPCLQVYEPCFHLLNTVTQEDIETIFSNIEAILELSR